MAATAEKLDPDLWDRVKAEVTNSDKGGEPGQWSARKAQLASLAYKRAGGRYKGKKTPDNHLQQWTQEDWGTKSGKASGETGERYLLKAARDHLSAEEYRRTTAKKRADTRKGKQFSPQPKDVAAKTAADRATGSASTRRRSTEVTKADLLARAGAENVRGRSRMTKAELEKAVG